jgi:NTE family protein
MKGLCLAGGGIKAAAHIGALKAFEEENIKFDCVSGASSGSIIATMYALGYSSDEIWQMFQRYCKKIKYADWKNIFKIIIGLIFQRRIVVDGLNSGKMVEKIMKEICQEKGVSVISEIKMPLAISMVDLQKGTVYIASSKEQRSILLDNTEFITDIPIATAIRSSCSFPVVFSPCQYEGLQLIDGGTRENLPWRPLKQIGADEVYGISFDTVYNNKECCNNLIDVAARAMELQGRELYIYEKAGIDKDIKIRLKKVSLLDSSKIHELYEIGYRQTKNQIKKW